MADLCPLSSSQTGERQRKEEKEAWEDMTGGKMERGDKDSQFFVLCVHRLVLCSTSNTRTTWSLQPVSKDAESYSEMFQG